MQTLTTKIHTFFSPLRPLGQAVFIFLKTNLGIVVLCIVGIVIVGRIVLGIGYRYMDRKGTMECMGGSHYRNYSKGISQNDRFFDEANRKFDEMEQTIQHRNRMMQDRMDGMDRKMKSNLMMPQKTDIGSGNTQSVSVLNNINGQMRGYSLEIKDNIIQGTFTGIVNQELTAAFQKIGVSLTGTTFQSPYNVETLQKIMTILEDK